MILHETRLPQAPVLLMRCQALKGGSPSRRTITEQAQEGGVGRLRCLAENFRDYLNRNCWRDDPYSELEGTVG